MNKPQVAVPGFTELSTTDLTATKTLLERAFNWTFEEVQMPAGKYLSYRSPEGGTVGIRPARLAEAPTSMNYVRVTDLNAAQKTILALGGKVILSRTDIPRMGSFFWFMIPSGPMMACWQDAPSE